MGGNCIVNTTHNLIGYVVCDPTGKPLLNTLCVAPDNAEKFGALMETMARFDPSVFDAALSEEVSAFTIAKEQGYTVRKLQAAITLGEALLL
jgi:hypothetical protein